MEYFGNYDDDRPPEEAPPPPPTPEEQLLVANSAPHVDNLGMQKVEAFNPLSTTIFHNPKVAAFAPLRGPVQPHQMSEVGSTKVPFAGKAEVLYSGHFAFDAEYNSFLNRGIAADPSDFGTRVDGLTAAMPSEEKPGPPVDPRKKRKKAGRDPSKEDYLGPWSPFEGEAERMALLLVEMEEKKKAEAEKKQLTDEAQAVPVGSVPREVTIHHAQDDPDYVTRSWIAVPPGCRAREEGDENFIPKRHICTFSGHTMGVQAIRFFPVHGHLLLSASLDSKVKIWDSHSKRKCLRTYMGHEQAIRDVQFAEGGSKFYSCSYDKNILLWDTEYGKIIGKFSNGKTPYCVTVHPDEDKQNIFIIGSSDKKAVQFDAVSGNIVQEYNEHLAAVNTVTFVDDNRKLVTTSDDKKMFIWEYGIPVVVKHVAEPFMHSMPAVSIHPGKKFIAAQSMDNQIVVYEAAGRFRFQGKRRFKGHTNAGYAIGIDFSPNGEFIISGDAVGKLWFWDWRTMKNFRTLQCHDGVCITCAWHPSMSSRVATAGWDGVIKMWE